MYRHPPGRPTHLSREIEEALERVITAVQREYFGRMLDANVAELVAAVRTAELQRRERMGDGMQ